MKTTFIITALAILGFGYLVYLNWGCEGVGIMTWSGRVCIEV